MSATRWARSVLTGLLCISLPLGLTEGLIRLHVVRPIRQVVRGHGLRTIDGVPVWLGDDPVQRENRVCVDEHPERIRIAFFGSSVAYGEYSRADQSFAWLLEQQLNATWPKPGFCVLNFSTPGFLHEQRMARASEELPRYRPTLVFIQDNDLEWLGTTKCSTSTSFRMLGDAAYDARHLKLRSDGFPGLPGVPDAVNRFLFLHSQLYQYTVLARGVDDDLPASCTTGNPGLAYRKEKSREIAALVRSYGGRPAFIVAADLTRSLARPSPFETEMEAPLIDLGHEEGIPVFILREALANQNNEEIRRDLRHFNAEGHRVVAAILARAVPDLLGLPPP